MTSYRQMYTTFFFHTKGRYATMNSDSNRYLQLMWGIIKNKKSKLYQLIGVGRPYSFASWHSSFQCCWRTSWRILKAYSQFLDKTIKDSSIFRVGQMDTVVFTSSQFMKRIGWIKTTLKGQKGNIIKRKALSKNIEGLFDRKWNWGLMSDIF